MSHENKTHMNPETHDDDLEELYRGQRELRERAAADWEEPPNLATQVMTTVWAGDHFGWVIAGVWGFDCLFLCAYSDGFVDGEFGTGDVPESDWERVGAGDVSFGGAGTGLVFVCGGGVAVKVSWA